MDFLKEPELGKTPLEIFLECVEGYQGKPGQEASKQQAFEKRERLKKCCNAVEESGKLYKENVPHDPFKEAVLPTNVSRKELENVYKEKFSDEDSPGRKYYDQIRRSKECGRCPICGGTGITHLDHYLPKSTYPTLCVNPSNLIPICDTCNTVKGTTEFKYEDGLPLHLYFDYFPISQDKFGDRYVEAFLVADLDAEFHATFRIECPAGWKTEWEKGLFKRLQNHFSMYHLCDRYSANVFSEYAKINDAVKTYVKKIVVQLAKKDGRDPRIVLSSLTENQRHLYEVEALHKVILSGEESESGDLNSWRSALYRALVSKEEALAVWLRANEGPIYENIRQCAAAPVAAQ